MSDASSYTISEADLCAFANVGRLYLDAIEVKKGQPPTARVELASGEEAHAAAR